MNPAANLIHKRNIDESLILKSVLEFLQYHPRVEWAERMNTGAMKIQDTTGKKRFIKFGFKGMSDIFGQLKQNGKLIAIETKRAGKYATDDQKAFLTKVFEAGGCAGVARSIEDAERIIEGEFLL